MAERTHFAQLLFGRSQMLLQVVDAESGQPLPETKLYLFYLRQDGRGTAVRQVTVSVGANGRPLPSSPDTPT